MAESSCEESDRSSSRTTELEQQQQQQQETTIHGPVSLEAADGSRGGPNSVADRIRFTQSPGGGSMRSHVVGVAEPWNDETMSDLSTSYSKTSSAYFNPGEVQAIRKGNTEQYFSGANQNKNRLAAATVMRRCLSSSAVVRPNRGESATTQPLTEETLAMKNHFSPPSRSFNNGASAGFRGLLDRTQEVPNLLDDTASDCTSAVSAATSRHSKGTVPSSSHNNNNNNYTQQRQQQRHHHQHVGTIDEEGVSGSYRSDATAEEDETEGVLGATSRTSMDKLNLALLGGGLTTIQTTTGDFSNRKTASDFDETLTNSDCDQYGFAKIPAFHEMLSAGMNQHDRALTSESLRFASIGSAEQEQQRQQQQFLVRGRNQTKHTPVPIVPLHGDADGDFSRYYIHPEEMQVLVKKFRKISMARCQYFDYEELEREEDATKAFALSEMRSRIMEKDIERGLERRGGTTVVDDIVLTSYHKAALRVRDAVIVARAWRDGATPEDIVNTANLTRRDERSYCIPRLDSYAKGGASKYTWEEVGWIDDNALPQYRCHSIGPRHLKGVEMFTIGDCQSILLKLSYERCQELRSELNAATATQIDAEGVMKEEGDAFDGMMTEAEMTYLTSMENVKSISQKLVLAEKSFALVKNRIERLVAKYEALLVHFENETESVAPSSVFSYESSCYSDYSLAAAKQREDEALARKAQRAELRAELVARESLLLANNNNPQGTTSVRRAEKEREVHNLKARIAELQSETSNAHENRDPRSAVLARAIARTNQSNRAAGESGGGGRSYNRSKIDDIKQRFRNRSAAKSGGNNTTSNARHAASSGARPSAPVANDTAGHGFHNTVGEEMFQHLDFYERSLKAVEDNH